MLYYTPILFLINVYHAHLLNETILMMLFSSLTASSILHHAKKHDYYKGKSIVNITDKLLAHITTGYILYDNYLQDLNIWSIFTYTSILYIISTYYIINFTKKNTILHASIHFVCVLGSNSHLYNKSLNNPVTSFRGMYFNHNC